MIFLTVMFFPPGILSQALARLGRLQESRLSHFSRNWLIKQEKLTTGLALRRDERRRLSQAAETGAFGDVVRMKRRGEGKSCRSQAPGGGFFRNFA